MSVKYLPGAVEEAEEAAVNKVAALVEFAV